jgi:hypothetical protein
MRVHQKSELAMSLARCDPRDDFEDETVALPPRIARPRRLAILLNRQPDLRLAAKIDIGERGNSGKKLL